MDPKDSEWILSKCTQMKLSYIKIKTRQEKAKLPQGKVTAAD